MTVELEGDELIGWDDIKTPPKGGGGKKDGPSLFLKLAPAEKPYHVRLVFTPRNFRRHRYAFRTLKAYPISPATDFDQKDLDIAWNKGKYQPQMRYWTLLFHRDCDNKLRIIEDGAEVFDKIAAHGRNTGVNPASRTKGWDWIISVKKDATGKWTYDVSIDTTKNGPTPLTDEEIAAIEKTPLFTMDEMEKKFFAKATPQDIKDLWEQLPEGLRENKKNSKTDQGSGVKSAPKTEKPAEKPAEKPVEKQASKPEVKAEDKSSSKPAEANEPPNEVPGQDFLDDKDASSENDANEASEAGDEGGDGYGDDAPARLF